MKADFLNKKISFLLAVCAAAVCAFFAYAAVVRGEKVIADNHSFYFLISAEENASASAQTAYWHGGAGYVLVRGKQEYAVYACYYSETTAERVQKNLSDRGMDSYLHTENSGKLFLKTKKEKLEEENICGVLKTMQETLSLLGNLSVYADTGEYTQSQLKSCLTSVSSVLRGLGTHDKNKIYSDFCARILQSENRISYLSNNIIYSRDIRYEEVFLCDAYLKFTGQFSQ